MLFCQQRLFCDISTRRILLSAMAAQFEGMVNKAADDGVVAGGAAIAVDKSGMMS